MAYKNLKKFIDVLEKNGELKRISVQVDSHLEITEITDRIIKRNGPALFFENVKNSRYPLFINGFGSYKRINLAFQVETIEDLGNRIRELSDLRSYATLLDKIKSLPKLTQLATIFPRKTGLKNCQREIDNDPDLDQLPILTCWPGDGGPFITLPLVITRDPETGVHNMGMYRMQVFDSKTTGMHWHIHKDGYAHFQKHKQLGQRMPVAVALGCDPATIYAATAPLPPFVDEYLFAGFLRKAPLDLTQCATNPLYVPANAEFVLEGYIDPTEPLQTEGPFGDHTGYYSLQGLYPRFHLTCITSAKDPIYPATIVGKPPMEDCFLGKVTERLFLPLIQMQIPEIIDINFPLEGVFHNCVIVSINKQFPGHAKKVMHAIWGTGQMMYTKMVIVVDKEVPVHDLSTVAWKVFNNIDPARDVVILEGPLDALDHASPLGHIGHKIGIDATKTWAAEGRARDWPDEIEMTSEIKSKVSQRWMEYGF